MNKNPRFLKWFSFRCMQQHEQTTNKSLHVTSVMSCNLRSWSEHACSGIFGKAAVNVCASASHNSVTARQASRLEQTSLNRLWTNSSKFTTFLLQPNIKQAEQHQTAKITDNSKVKKSCPANNWKPVWDLVLFCASRSVTVSFPLLSFVHQLPLGPSPAMSAEALKLQ